MIPQRDFNNNRLDNKKVSIIGLGCSSFSAFFDSKNGKSITVETLNRNDPIVQEWIQTVHYAVLDAGITLLDTAPWYGHGTSEVVVGWALESLLKSDQVDRSQLIINTKVGRYEAEPSQQFDFSREMTLKSARRSLERLGLDYINVLQLHDPEFSPSLEMLLEETIPAMIECREKGICKSLGMTGYPLQVQHQIIQATLDHFSGVVVWDQALTYAHFNLHDDSLYSGRLPSTESSFAKFCQDKNIALLAAAPLSLGLLTPNKPPGWHPAPNALKLACRRAVEACGDDVDIAKLAILVAIAHPSIPCTILGMKSIGQVKIAESLANRLHDVRTESRTHSECVQSLLSEKEREIYLQLVDHIDGPFAEVLADGTNQWDGVTEAWNFWRKIPNATFEKWQIT